MKIRFWEYLYVLKGKYVLKYECWYGLCMYYFFNYISYSVIGDINMYVG